MEFEFVSLVKLPSFASHPIQPVPVKHKLLLLIGLLLASSSWAANGDTAGEEFVGPFPSWRDLKRDYGAKGDGQANDTEELQRALMDLTQHADFSVLYVPAGVYRLTEPVRTLRRQHTDALGVALIGEDPATTVFLWDGPRGAPILTWDAWYSKISRLTLDGAGRAGAALFYGPAFSTYNETSDMVFRDAQAGIHFGEDSTQGQAENAVSRCRFLRCSLAGVLTENWNSMDIWVWNSRFEDCRFGLLNQMGNFHAWHNLFLRSTEADIATRNLMVFSFVGNTSVGSRRFLDFDTGHSWGAPTTIAANRILEPTADFPVKLGNAGPYLVMDNSFKLPVGTTNRAVKMTWADQTFVGNRYTATNAVAENGRFRRIAEHVVAPGAIDPSLPTLPPTPPHRERKVFEVPAGADADAIQRAIDAAAKVAGQRPVVHLPKGSYSIAQTLVVPPRCDLQVVGDGAGETATVLHWTGGADGVLLRLEGPSHATLRDLHLDAGRARGLVVEDADQPGGRIFAEQLNANGPNSAKVSGTAAVRVNGLVQTDVQLRFLQGAGNAGHWVEVVGAAANAPGARKSIPPSAEVPAANQVSVFNGATGSATGQYNVREGGRLVVRGVYHEKSADALRGIYLADAGTLAIDATRFSYKTSPTAPLVDVDGFRGWFTLATGLLLPVDSTNTCRFEITGDGSRANVLALNDQFWVQEFGVTAQRVWQNRAQPPAAGGLVGCNVNSPLKGATSNGFAFLANQGDHPDPARSVDGSGPLADQGTVADAALLRHLAPLREARVWEPGDTAVAPDATDVRIHRVMVTGGSGATVEFRRGP